MVRLVPRAHCHVRALLEPSLAVRSAAISDGVRTAFFVLNVTGVSLTAYVLLQYTMRARDEAFARSEALLLNVLPKAIAHRLKREPGVIAESHDDVTDLFADVVDFTPFAEHTEPARVVGVLNDIFTAFDSLAQRHGLERIKTIGDAYMVAAGLPDPRADHATAMAEMALEMRDEFARHCKPLGLELSIRIGIASGPVIAGVIGTHKFTYDLWGDTVNTAIRMELQGLADRIQVSEATYRLLGDVYVLEDRGEVDVKGKGRLRAYLLVGRRVTDEAGAVRT